MRKFIEIGAYLRPPKKLHIFPIRIFFSVMRFLKKTAVFLTIIFLSTAASIAQVGKNPQDWKYDLSIDLKVGNLYPEFFYFSGDPDRVAPTGSAEWPVAYIKPTVGTGLSFDFPTSGGRWALTTGIDVNFFKIEGTVSDEEYNIVNGPFRFGFLEFGIPLAIQYGRPISSRGYRLTIEAGLSPTYFHRPNSTWQGGPDSLHILTQTDRENRLSLSGILSLGIELPMETKFVFIGLEASRTFTPSHIVQTRLIMRPDPQSPPTTIYAFDFDLILSQVKICVRVPLL